MMLKYSTPFLSVIFTTACFQRAWAYNVPDDYTVDVHVHTVPDIYRQALVDAGFPVVDGSPMVDGFPVPSWNVSEFIQNREEYGYNYSIMSISAPGLDFIPGNGLTTVELARQLNDKMASYIGKYPTQLGAFCVLPMPNITASLAEISYCLDTLNFDGVGLYTNYNGTYLGDPKLDDVMAELDTRGTGVLVHPVQAVPVPNLLGLSSGDIEYPFDTTRAVLNMLNQGTRQKFPNVNLIFSHGGGTVPFLAGRISGFEPGLSGNGISTNESLMQMQGYHYDMAVSGSQPQLAALDAFLDTTHLLLGTDFPFSPVAGFVATTAAIFAYPGFSASDLVNIKHGNAMTLFPRILEKLDHENSKTNAISV